MTQIEFDGRKTAGEVEADILCAYVQPATAKPFALSFDDHGKTCLQRFLWVQELSAETCEPRVEVFQCRDLKHRKSGIGEPHRPLLFMRAVLNRCGLMK